ISGTGLVRVRSPLLTESRLMSFPPGTEMFQFSGFASPKLCIHFGDTFVTNFPVPARKLERENWRRWVSPFGNLRVKGCSHLTAAYRSVPRPSSPVYAKASTNCPYLTLENPHHHRQTCLHYTASIYR